MGTVRDVAVVVLGISLLVFIALFGHVPGLRNTPIGFAHRFLWKTIPRWFFALDRAITGGRLGPILMGTANYLMNEKHPIIMAFYLTLVTGGIYMFTKDGWKHLSSIHRMCVPIVATLPYITMYLAATSDPGFITPENHQWSLQCYPYDHLNFKPGNICRTCQLAKPARSKHCSICKHCVAKHDHHCVWINNCVGQLNTRHFLAFLAATNVLLSYGLYLSFGIIQSFILRALIPSKIAIESLQWPVYLHLLGISIVEEIYIGAVFLLCALTGILSYAFTIYHLYLIWAGTTTNETIKWSDWRDDIKNGDILLADPEEDDDITELDADEMCRDWPRVTTQLFYRIDPTNRGDIPREIIWRRVQGLGEIDNIYDLGWRRNFRDALWPRTFSPR